MQRRHFSALVATTALLGARSAGAADLNNADAASGIRVALERGAVAAVGLLGRPDGFLGNPKVRIPLPGFLNDAAKVLRFTGQQQRVDDLVTAMNRAAEAAVPEAKALLVAAVKSISVGDARRIVTGGDDSVTRFFADKTRAPLGERFLPIVKRYTAQGRSRRPLQRRRRQGRQSRAGQGRRREHRSLRDEEGARRPLSHDRRGRKKIRSDPVGTGSAILAKVFGR